MRFIFNDNRLLRSLLGMMVIGAYLYAGCSQLEASVDLAEPLERELPAQTLDLRNCDSKTVLRRSLASAVDIAQEITLSDEATSLTSGEAAAIPPQFKAKLETEIARAYQQEFDRVKNDAEQKELTVPAGRIHMYRIEWKQRVYTSTVSFSMDDEAYTAAYTYELCVPAETGYWEMACTA